MTLSPSGLRDLYQSSTPIHDAMQLWLSDESNQMKIINKVIEIDRQLFLVTITLNTSQRA